MITFIILEEASHIIGTTLRSFLPLQDLQMLANLPHVVAHFVRPGQQQKQGEQMEGSAPASGLFLLDSGAGGVELMLHARAAQELQVQAAPHVRTHTLKVRALVLLKCVHCQSHLLTPGENMSYGTVSLSGTKASEGRGLLCWSDTSLNEGSFLRW